MTSHLTDHSPAILLAVGDVDHAGDVLAQELVADLAQHLSRPRHWRKHLEKRLELKLLLGKELSTLNIIILSRYREL